MKKYLRSHSTGGFHIFTLLALFALAFFHSPKAVACPVYPAFIVRIDSLQVTVINQSTISNGVAAYSLNMGAAGTPWQFYYLDAGFDSVTFTYTTPGWKTIILTMYDTTNNTCSDTAMMRIKLVGCYLKAVVSKYQVNGAGVSFSSASTNLSGYPMLHAWTFGDGNSSAQKNPNHTYTGSGPYSAKYLITDTSYGQNCKDSFLFQVIMGACDTISYRSVYMGAKVFRFTPDSVGWQQMIWNFGYGGNVVKNAPVNFWAQHHNFPSNGTYLVKLTGIRQGLKYCLDTFAKMITVNDTTCSVMVNFTYTVSNKTVTITNTSSGGANRYLIEFGVPASAYYYFSSFTTHTYTYANYGNYTIKITAWDTNNYGCSSIRNQLVNVGGCSTTVDFEYRVLTGRNLAFYSKAVNHLGNPLRHYWDFGDGSSSIDPAPVHTYSGNGPYKITYVAADTTFGYNFCADSSYAFTNFSTCDTAAFTHTISGKTVTFATDTNWQTVYWNFGDNNSMLKKNATHTYAGFGYYNVKLYAKKVIDKKICDDSLFRRINLIAPPCYVNASFTIAPDTSNVYSGLIFNTSTITRPSRVSYIWYFGDGDSSTQQSPSHTYPGMGRYNLCLNLRDSSCGSSFCKNIGFDSAGNLTAFMLFTLKVVDPSVGLKPAQVHNAPLQVFPNPGKGFLNIVSENKNLGSLSLWDMSGRLLLQTDADGRNMQLDLSRFDRGVYILRVHTTDGGSELFKILRE